MLKHWVGVTARRYIFNYPPRPMVYLVVPSMLLSAYWGFQAFFNSEDEVEEEIEY